MFPDIKFLKAWLRTGSRHFASDYIATERGLSKGDGHAIADIVWHRGDGHQVYYRPGTSDVKVLYGILFKPTRKCEYWLPPDLPATRILDIGGNIGATTRYLAHHFPQARIDIFEPVPENLEVLRRNIERVGRVCVHAYGLGPADGEFMLSLPDNDIQNRGAWSLYAGQKSSKTVRCAIRQAAAALAETGIDRIDIIKIDTEGAEYDILRALPEEMLSKTAWIYGELHQENIRDPSDFRLLEYLSRWFEIGIYKPLNRRNYMFDACNKRLYERYKGFVRE